MSKISSKQVKISNLNINYKTIGDGKIPVVLLHGWGVDSEKYVELIKEFKIQSRELGTEFKILVPDLPGFGKSGEPKEIWNLDDYVEFVDEFIKKASREGGFELIGNMLKKMQKGSTALRGQWSQQSDNMYCHTENMQKMILIGHSFGGRIAIKYAVKYPEKIEKLILTGAAGIKRKLTFRQKIFYVLAKIGKKFFSLFLETKFPIGNLVSYSRKILYKLTGEKDYYQASPRMKKIMKNVLAEDLTPILEKIEIPTLLVWGKDDKTTPLADGKIMNKKIKNSELKIINNANHSLPYQKAEEFAKIAEEFIKKE